MSKNLFEAVDNLERYTSLKESSGYYVAMECNREGYGADQVTNDSVTVGELVNILSDFDEDMKIVTSHDEGYTYGSISGSDFSIKEVSADDEDTWESEKINKNSKSLKEAEYTPNARKCIDAANLLGQIDLNDIEDAAKIKTQIDKLFDKLIKLAPKLNKKEQKEIEEANKCNEESAKCEEDSESLKAAKANMKNLRKKYGYSKPESKSGEGDKPEFITPEANAELNKNAGMAYRAMKNAKCSEETD